MQKNTDIEYPYPYPSQKEIAKFIKPITCDDIKTEYILLKEYVGKECSSRCRVGNNIVDYFTFEERLRTKGKYNIHFYEFVERIDEFKKKKFIQNMLLYYENVKNKNKKKNKWVVYKEVYNICISAINIFRPLVAMDIYSRYRPTCVFDPCAGWGGRLVGAAVLNVPKYIGYEINIGLKEPYENMCHFLKKECHSSIEVELQFCDAIIQPVPTFYDMVFTSPPYYFLEKYPNNMEYTNKEDMNERFYIPLFQNSFDGLKKDGYFILNVNQEIYNNVCCPLLGEANEKIMLQKSKRQNEYSEYLYVWKK